MQFQIKQTTLSIGMNLRYTGQHALLAAISDAVYFTPAFAHQHIAVGQPDHSPWNT